MSDDRTTQPPKPDAAPAPKEEVATDVSEVARVRLEGKDAGSQSQLACLGADAVDERAVAAVHAVKVAYGQRTPAPGVLQ